MKNYIKIACKKYINYKNDRFIDERYLNELNAMKGKNYHARKLPERFRKEYLDYYASFGFCNVPLDWAEYIYSVKGDLDVGYVPDSLYHKFIDPYFPLIKYEVADKYLQPFVLSDFANYPETIVVNSNGIYLDSDMNVLNLDDVVKLLTRYDEFIVKPTVYNGAGLDVRLLHNSDNIKSIFQAKYKKDFIVQKKLEQHPLMAEFNESSVNTVRILTMIMDGQVYVLSSFLRMGYPGSIVDNSCGRSENFAIEVLDNGQLASAGYNLYSESTDRTHKGKPFSEFQIPKFNEMIEIAKKGQKRLSKHKLIAWDFALDKDGKVVVIEYNFKLHPIIYYEVHSGPLFGNRLDGILREAAEYKVKRNYT